MTREIPSSAGQPVEIRVRDLDAEKPSPSPNKSAPLSMGSLLRLFRSDFFDAFMAVTYLYRYRESRGVHDYLCNELYKISDADLETFMPQLCNLLVFHARNSPGLERFIMDKCADSIHMALQVFWFLQAAVEDAARKPDKEAEARCRLLRTRCETAAVNGSKHALLEAAATRLSAAALVAVDSPITRTRQVAGNTLFPSSSAGQLMVNKISLSDSHISKDTFASESARNFDRIEHKEAANGPVVSHVQQGSFDSAASWPYEDAVIDFLRGVFSSITFQEEEGAQQERIENSEKKLGNTSSDIPVQEKESYGFREAHSALKYPEGAETQMDSDDEFSSNDEDSNLDFDPVTLLTMKQERFDYFNDSVSIAKEFVRLSLTTREKPQEERKSHLRNGLAKINDILLRRMKGESGIPLVEDSPVPDASEILRLGANGALRSVHLPLTRANSQALRILRVHTDEVVMLTSRTRVPYLVNIEVLPTKMRCSDKLIFCEQRIIDEDKKCRDGERKPPKPECFKQSLPSENGFANGMGAAARNSLASGRGSHVRKLSDMTPAERQRANVRSVVYGDSFARQPDDFALAECPGIKEDVESLEYKSRQAVILGVYGELWSWKEERILSKSPFKDVKGARLMPFIVKAGDDLRQEQLAIQLISQFKRIFDDEGVDVFLRPFTVMCVSSEAGFVEVIPDSVSVHSLKKRTPNFVSLLDYFERAFGELGSPSFRAAQRRFIRSMAGYSLATYFLQIKDRHNGNIMIDAEGQIIHIDFGFMLTNSPGAIKFESVPFKLTEEYLQVICAKKNVLDLAEASKTEGYRYFQELFVLGMLAARKHYEKITNLVEIMSEGTTMPCMLGGHSIVETLRTRFAVGMPEEQCISFAMGLIEESRLSWRSAGYDRFQAYSNGYR